MAEASKLILTPGDPPATSPTDTKSLYYNALGQISIINDLGVVETLSNSAHTHDDRYYTEAEMTTFLSTKEPVFAKNTAFNKNFGTTAGTVSEGNHTHPPPTHPVNITAVDASYSTPMYIEPNRGKLLSVETCHFWWAEASVGNNEWMQTGHASDTDSGWIMPFDGTMIAITAITENCAGNTKGFRIYNDSYEEGTFITLSGSGIQSERVTDLDIDFIAGDRIRLRSGAGGTINDTTVSLLVKWR